MAKNITSLIRGPLNSKALLFPSPPGHSMGRADSLTRRVREAAGPRAANALILGRADFAAHRLRNMHGSMLGHSGGDSGHRANPRENLWKPC